MGRRELGRREARPWTGVQRGAKAGLAVLGLFLVGLPAAGALAEAGPLDLLTSTSSTSGSTDTTVG